jgi:SagB-type dehydrogenase family enzyme
MRKIPHDYYLRFLDSLVYDEVLDFHSKGNFSLHEAFKYCTGLHSLDEEHLAKLTGNELALYPDMELHVDLALSDDDRAKYLYRNESCDKFASVSVDFADIEKLVFPLLSRTRESYKRGYPSGGALYPVEIFVCSLVENQPAWPEAGRVLHLLPASRKFEVMQHDIKCEAVKAAMLSSPGDLGNPSAAIIYVAYMPKNIFKYRYRGYRMALMEVGSIYMLVEIQAKKLGLACRLWSAYTDSMLCKVLGLNPTLFFPMCVHFVGRQHEAH